MVCGEGAIGFVIGLGWGERVIRNFCHVDVAYSVHGSPFLRILTWYFRFDVPVGKERAL